MLLLTYHELGQLHSRLAREVTLGPASEATHGWQLHYKQVASVLASYLPTSFERRFSEAKVA